MFGLRGLLHGFGVVRCARVDLEELGSLIGLDSLWCASYFGPYPRYPDLPLFSLRFCFYTIFCDLLLGCGKR